MTYQVFRVEGDKLVLLYAWDAQGNLVLMPKTKHPQWFQGLRGQLSKLL